MCHSVRMKITRTIVFVEGLESFIRWYKPKGWCGIISEFTFVPYITDQEFEIILQGKIPEDKKFEPCYIKEAIKAWMDKELDIPTE